jgi:myo-inositol 2-dehydrogenase / D-chiro-inositol 1-dehydrogenase
MNSPFSGQNTRSSLTRRRFLAGTGASVVSFSIAKPSLVFGSQANSKINIGIAGCGRRGAWIGSLFQAHGGYTVAGLADYFRDRVDETGAKLKVPEGRRYTGLAGYKRLLEQEVDALVIETAAYFHPEQAAAAVSAGKHVFLAKPIAVDVPGCLSIQESAKIARSKKLCFLVDFQTRTHKAYKDAIQKIRDGEIGQLVSIEAAYHCPLMFEGLDRELRKDPKNPELRLRCWSIDRALSGDVITEQNIHSLDVASWVLDGEPVSACGTGGKVRDFVGDCWDRFAVIFHYPNGIFVSFNSHQVGFGCDDILCRIHGTKGTVETHYGGNVIVKAKETRSEESTANLYRDGAVANIASFHEAISKGASDISTVAPSVRSNLVTILGRSAAYKHGMVTWEEMMQKREAMKPLLQGLKA